MNKAFAFFLTLCATLLFQCGPAGNVGIVVPKEPYNRLSEYNFFDGDMAGLIPAERVLPYDLNSSLFSDYAYKARFVWMPEGTSAKYDTEHVLQFPPETVLIKNFFYNYDETDLTKGRRILETRILINRGSEWQAVGYVWNEDQTDAVYDVTGEITEISWVDASGSEQEIEYIIPNRNQCKTCHEFNGKQLPIGPKVRNLNKDFAYNEGARNQLQKWTETGYLAGYSPELAVEEKVAVWDDPEENLHDRAMAYLDINCGHCHNPKGAANTSGLTLLADSEMGISLGIYKATVSAGAGTGGHTYSIVPGQPDQSIMVYRMQSLNPGAMMPEVGRTLVHEEGVDLIKEWIAEMDPSQYNTQVRSSLN